MEVKITMRTVVYDRVARIRRIPDLLAPVRNVETHGLHPLQNIWQFRSKILYDSLFPRSLLLRGKVLVAFLSFTFKYLLTLDATPCQLEYSADAEEHEDGTQPS